MTVAAACLHGPTAAALAIVALTGLAACGDDEATTPATRKSPTTVVLRASADARDKLVLSAPSTIAAGQVRLVLRNADTRPREAQLVRVAGSHTIDEVLAVREADEGAPTPAWLRFDGGVAVVAPGRSSSVVQTLAPGTYYVIDGEKDGPADDPKIPIHGRLGATARFVVEGSAARAELPDAPATITATEYDYAITGLKRGLNRVRFVNAGRQPHHAVLFPLAKGRTIDDVARFFGPKPPPGPPPLDVAGARSLTAIEGGREQIAELELRTGTYAVVCFLSDRSGGRPHVARGQVREAIVG
ncbi:MAG: hypothetical protein ACRDMZ_18990 [Solirubrobacteraceae bacterium]